MDKIKKMGPKEFRDTGFLFELNRQFLHPLGLALEVVVEDDETVRFGEIWDYQDDPDGMIFGEETITPDLIQKAKNIAKLRAEKEKTRKKNLGYVIQPLPEMG